MTVFTGREHPLNGSLILPKLSFFTLKYSIPYILTIFIKPNKLTHTALSPVSGSVIIIDCFPLTMNNRISITQIILGIMIQSKTTEIVLFLKSSF